MLLYSIIITIVAATAGYLLWTKRELFTKEGLNVYWELEKLKIDNEFSEKRQAAEKEHREFLDKMNRTKVYISSEIQQLDKTLSDFQLKRDAIAKDLMDKQELEMAKDFNRLVLDEQVRDDIHFLLSIESKINNKEVLRKLIWSAYLQPAATELFKRVLGNRVISGIYKITHESGLVYIGKSVNIKNRWTEHLRSSLSIGTIASQKIHEALKDKWHEFTFEVLQECSKEKLNETERYYIEFYKSSSSVGYNMKKG